MAFALSFEFASRPRKIPRRENQKHVHWDAAEAGGVETAGDAAEAAAEAEDEEAEADNGASVSVVAAAAAAR